MAILRRDWRALHSPVVTMLTWLHWNATNECKNNTIPFASNGEREKKRSEQQQHVLWRISLCMELDGKYSIFGRDWLSTFPFPFDQCDIEFHSRILCFFFCVDINTFNGMYNVDDDDDWAIANGKLWKFSNCWKQKKRTVFAVRHTNFDETMKRQWIF